MILDMKNILRSNIKLDVFRFSPLLSISYLYKIEELPEYYNQWNHLNTIISSSNIKKYTEHDISIWDLTLLGRKVMKNSVGQNLPSQVDLLY